MQKRIRATQPPKTRWLPLRGNFRASSGAEETITQLAWQQEMRGCRRGLKEKCPRYFVAKQVIVMIEKSRDIDVKLLPNCAPVAQFVAVELFGREISTRVESDTDRQPTRRAGDIPQGTKISLQIGRSSHGMGKSRPHGLRVCWGPEEPD